MTQEHADTLPILICRDSRYGRTGATCLERKGPKGYSLEVSSKILVFRRIFLKCDTKPSTKSLQDAVIQSCAGVEVIPKSPLEGDSMVNCRVELAAREVKRQCRTLWISAEQNTSVRIADRPLLSWFSSSAAQVMNNMRIGKDQKTSKLKRTGQKWSKHMAQFGETFWFCKKGEHVVTSFANRMIHGIFVGHHARTGAVLCITKEVGEAKVGRDSH